MKKYYKIIVNQKGTDVEVYKSVNKNDCQKFLEDWISFAELVKKNTGVGISKIKMIEVSC